VREKIVSSRWLEKGDRRLDTGPYLSGKMEILERIGRLRAPKEPLATLTKGQEGGIYNGPQFVRRYVVDRRFGVPFLTSSAFLRADLSFSPLISRRDAESDQLSFLRIEPSMILISCSGTTGRMVFANDTMRDMWSSQDIMKVVPDPRVIAAGYLYAYLASNSGIPLITGDTYGSMITHLEPGHLAGLPVPRLGDVIEKTAHEMVLEAAKLRTEYQRQLGTATRQLFESVGLQDVTSSAWHSGTSDLGFVRKIGSPSSLRALNFNPRFLKLCDVIQSRSSRSLGELCKPGTLHRGGRYKRIDAAPQYSYQLIGQKEIFWLRPEGRWIAKKSVGDDVLVTPGTTLVAAQGTFGESELYCRSEFVWGRDAERAYSEHFLRVVADEGVVLPGCLFAFMRSETAFRMLRSISMGTKLQDHHPEFLHVLPVPYPPDERTREEIHELVVDAYEKRHRSVQLEDEAVALVERAIEGVA
jgi:hypothetical protein